MDTRSIHPLTTEFSHERTLSGYWIIEPGRLLLLLRRRGAISPRSVAIGHWRSHCVLVISRSWWVRHGRLKKRFIVSSSLDELFVQLRKVICTLLVGASLYNNEQPKTYPSSASTSQSA